MLNLTVEEKKQFVVNNYHWLERWLDDPKDGLVEDCQTDDFQLFKKILSRTSSEVTSEWHNRIKLEVIAHKKEILLHAIFNEMCSNYITGFVARTGRLPNPDDKVRFRYFGGDTSGNRFLRTEIRDFTASILSHCSLEILNYDEIVAKKSKELLVSMEKAMLSQFKPDIDKVLKDLVINAGATTISNPTRLLVIKEFPCNNKGDILKKEGYWYRNLRNGQLFSQKVIHRYMQSCKEIPEEEFDKWCGMEPVVNLRCCRPENATHRIILQF